MLLGYTSLSGMDQTGLILHIGLQKETSSPSYPMCPIISITMSVCLLVCCVTSLCAGIVGERCTHQWWYNDYCQADGVLWAARYRDHGKVALLVSIQHTTQNVFIIYTPSLCVVSVCVYLCKTIRYNMDGLFQWIVEMYCKLIHTYL